MDDTDDFFRESHYNIIRILLSLSGLWPFHSVGKRRAIYFIFLLVFGSGLFFQIWEIKPGTAHNITVLGVIEIRSDSFELVDAMPLLVLGLLSIIKIVCMAYTLPKVKILLIRMKEYWYSPKSDEETKILNSYALFGRKFGYAYAVVILSHSAIYQFTTLMSRLIQGHNTTMESSNGPQLGLPYRVNYMVDLDTYYAPIFTHAAFCDVYYILLIVAIDVLFLTLVQHCCGLFAALRYRLENAFDFKDCANDLTRTIAQDGSYANLAYSIRRHTEAMQFTSIMESIYRLPLLLHVGYNISIISIVGFQALTTSNANNILRHGIYLNGALVNTFFENWQGQKIIDHSEKVYEAAYNARWYEMPIAAKKLLIMVMMRSIKPSQITAGKLIVMSYVNFNAVMRMSSSYLMLLRSMQDL